MTYHVQILLLVRQPLFDRAALLLTQTSWVLPPLSVGKMTLRLYGALNYSHGLSKGPSFGTGRGAAIPLTNEMGAGRNGPCGSRVFWCAVHHGGQSASGCSRMPPMGPALAFVRKNAAQESA